MAAKQLQRMSRFECPSGSLGLGRLLVRSRRSLGAALVLAWVMHGSVAALREWGAEQKAARPLTVQFIKREPRLSKPLEMKKRPVPKQRHVQRQMVSVKARLARDTHSSAPRPSQALGGLARPRTAPSRGAHFDEPVGEPQVLAGTIDGAREPANKVDMALEMVDIESLDTGRYQALVIQDPTDKRNVRGYFHIAQAYVPSVAEANRTRRYGVYYDSPLVYPHALQRLAEYVTKYTAIQCDISCTYPVGSAEIYETPYVMTCTQVGFEINESEAKILGSYLTRGGFLHANGPAIKNIPATWANRRMLEDALSTQDLDRGRDWDFERVPNDHPLYHCFFDFDGAPPGWDNYGVGRGYVPEVNDYIEGVTIAGRLIGIVDFKNYVVCWAWMNPSDWARRFGSSESPNGTRQYQFAVNLIVFVLTQEGSITKRVMDSVQ